MTRKQIVLSAFFHRETAQENCLEFSRGEFFAIVKCDKKDEFFDRVLKAPHIPNQAAPEGDEEQWDILAEFERSTFDDAAYQKLLGKIFKNALVIKGSAPLLSKSRKSGFFFFYTDAAHPATTARGA